MEEACHFISFLPVLFLLLNYDLVHFIILVSLLDFFSKITDFFPKEVGSAETLGAAVFFPPLPLDLLDFTPVGSAETLGAAVFFPPLPSDLLDFTDLLICTPVGSAETLGAEVFFPLFPSDLDIMLASTKGARRAQRKTKKAKRFLCCMVCLSMRKYENLKLAKEGTEV